MTVRAETPLPLKRLFERLDFALQPKHQALVYLLSHWTDQRGGAIPPRVPRTSSFRGLRRKRRHHLSFGLPTGRETSYSCPERRPSARF